MITFNKILSLRTNILSDHKVKLVRHKDNRAEYRELIKDRDELIKYQRAQAKEIFKGCDYICTFYGLQNSRSLFIGVFKVNGVEVKPNGQVEYDLVEVPGFEDLVDRLVIDWGKAAISWHQWATNDKEVIEIMPKGSLGEFPGILDFILEFKELETLSESLEANRSWYHHLSSINGIYLILDDNTGKQYVGSAYGKEGIWQRWKEYAATGHGGNKLLRELCKNNPNYHKKFHFSVLQTLPSNLSSREVIAFENLYKNKLGTRSFGLNAN